MIKFTVPGSPVAKERPRFAKRGKFIVTYTPTKTKTAETSIAEYARYYMGFANPLEGVMWLDLAFYLPIPKEKRKTIENDSWHVCKPDADNLAKLASDALNGICYHDDSQIARLTITKRYSDNPRTEITITVL